MRLPAFVLVLCLATCLPVLARLGDSVEQTVVRYGDPVASAMSSIPGGLTSTRTFSKDGLEIICGYVAGRVEMIRYARVDRPYVQTEVDAILHTNTAKGQAWTPDASSAATYRRPDGATATITDMSVDITTPKWRDALAKDEVMGKAASDSETNSTSGEMGSRMNAAGETNSPAPVPTNSAP